MLLEDGGDGCAVGCSFSGQRTQFFVELVTATGGVDDDDFAWLFGCVEECVGHALAAIFEKAHPGVVSASIWPPPQSSA